MTTKTPRRRRLAGLTATALVAGLALAGCSSERADETAAPTDSFSVTHAMGTTTIPGDPQRIVVLDSPHLDALVALGVTPVGLTESGAGAGAPPYLGDSLAEAEIVGMTSEPDIDAIALLDPDLIIGAKVRHEAIYDELSGIAPTVFSENSGTDWKEQARITAAAIDATAEMETLLADLSARAADVGEEVGAAGRTVSMVRFRPDNFRLYGPQTFSGSVLAEVGFLHSEREWNEYSMAELSPELYEDIDGEIIFHANPGGDADATTKSTITQLWSSLPAVQAGQEYEVEDETWMVGIGVIGANEIIDTIEDLLG